MASIALLLLLELALHLGSSAFSNSSYRLVCKQIGGNLSLVVPLIGALEFWLLGAIVVFRGLYNWFKGFNRGLKVIGY